jgi:hypothetical protein
MAVQAVAANPDSTTAQALNSVFYQSEATSQELYQAGDQRGPGANFNRQSPSEHSDQPERSTADLDAVDFSGLVVAEVALPHLTSAQGKKI